MNLSSLSAIFLAQLAKAKAFAWLHRFALILTLEILGVLLLLWGFAYRPRTCIVLAIGFHLLRCYGGKLFIRPEV